MSEYPYIWRFADDREYLRRQRGQEPMPPLMICVAITGGAHGKEVNPNHPETLEEQVEETYKAYKLGACAVHIHSRDPDTGYAWVKSEPEIYRKINKAIRERCPDIIINNTTGGGFGATKEQRISSTEALPEMASLNCGPMMARATIPKRPPPLEGRPEDIPVDVCVPITYGETQYFAQTMLERGVKPELELYHPAQYEVVDNLIRKGLVKPPYFIQFVMGFQTSALPTLKGFLAMLDGLPDNAMFEVAGIMSAQVPMLTLAMLFGGHVRTGLEDVILYRKGELATTTKLVERVLRLAELLDRPIATPGEARRMLGISETPRQY